MHVSEKDVLKYRGFAHACRCVVLNEACSKVYKLYMTVYGVDYGRCV